MSIATALLEQLTQLARQHNATRITEVHVVCGVMRQVVPEALEWAFAAVSAGTPAEGAVLKVTEQSLVAQCRKCGERFEAAIDDYRCPGCAVPDVELVAGHDIVLKSVVCETEDRAAV